MIRYGIAGIMAAGIVASASVAEAHLPEIYGYTTCADGEPAVGWDVVSSGPEFGWAHPQIVVSASFDGGEWLLVGAGEFASPDFGFSGSMLVSGVSEVRLRARAVGPWSDSYWWEGPFYADGSQLDVAAATVFQVPSDCAPPPPSNPGTGTPGYWRNHPDAWPVDTIDLGGLTYTKAEAIEILSSPTKGDKTITMARAVIAAVLNVTIGNDGSCIANDLYSAQSWLAAYPIGSGVKASSDAWAVGEPLATRLDDYNNGFLCAPHRD